MVIYFRVFETFFVCLGWLIPNVVTWHYYKRLNALLELSLNFLLAMLQICDVLLEQTYILKIFFNNIDLQIFNIFHQLTTKYFYWYDVGNISLFIFTIKVAPVKNSEPFCHRNKTTYFLIGCRWRKIICQKVKKCRHISNKSFIRVQIHIWIEI